MTTDLMFATQRPFSQEAFVEPSGTPAWKSMPSWYLVASADHAIPPVTERFMAERAGAQTSEVKASHVPQISQPEAVKCMGGAAALRVQMGTPARPTDLPGVEQTLATARNLLSEETFARAWPEAQAEPIEQFLSMIPNAISLDRPT